MSIFQDLHRKGMTIIIVTHEPEIAEFTRRCLMFRDGKIISDRLNDRINEIDTSTTDVSTLLKSESNKAEVQL